MLSVELLENAKLSRTACRIDVLDALIAQKRALTEKQLREYLSQQFDRSTLYRTLKTLVESQLVHAIAAANGEVSYALNYTLRMPVKTEHPHFQCSLCGHIFCIGFREPVEMQIPEGFTSDYSHFIVFGTCKNCNLNPNN